MNILLVLARDKLLFQTFSVSNFNNLT